MYLFISLLITFKPFKVHLNSLVVIFKAINIICSLLINIVEHFLQSFTIIYLFIYSGWTPQGIAELAINSQLPVLLRMNT